MTPTEKETIAQLFDLEKESKQREEENYSQIADLFLEPRASTVGEKWGAAVNVGASNFEADVERYSLMGNVLLGNDNAAKLNEARIKRHEANSAQLSQNFGSFEEFLKEPTFAGFAEQVVTQVGKFVPNAVASAASAVGGMGVGALAKYGLTQTSKRYANKLITDAARRKMSLGTYDVVSREIVEQAYKEGRSQAMKRGAIAGAFAQEQFIGTSQSISEYQEAGREITRSEALMANLLGIPQAVVGTFGEVYFAKALFKGALRNTGLGLVLKKVRDGKALSPAQKALHKAWNKLESKKPTTQAERDLIKGALGGKNGKVATFLKDIAVGFTKSGIVESGTETVQEGLGTLQRFAIDPEYTGEEARLRMAEAAFGGYFAGGARGGIGSAGTSVIRQAREALANKEQALIDLQGRDPNVTPVGETPAQIQGMADGVVRTDNNKDFLWVSNTSVKKPPKVEKEESYTLDNLRGFYKKAQEKARAAQADFDKAVVDIEYSAEERAGIMTDELQADMVDKLAAEDFIKQQYANLPKNNVKAALDEQFAITETSRVFEQIGSERIRKVDYDKLYALNARLLELQDAPVGETPEQKNKRRKEYEKLQEEKAEFIDDLKAGVKYATDRAADQLDNLELYNNYGQRIVPNFNKAWAKKNNLIVKEYKTGTAYTTNADKIDLLDQSPNDSPDAGSLAVVLNFNSVDTKNHDRVLEVLDEQGRVLKQETTNAEGLDGALLKAKEDYPTVTKLEEGGRSGGYTWQVRALDEVVRDRAMSANLEDLYQDMEESENLEEGETSRTEVDLNTGQTVDMDGLTAEENAASVTDVVIYNKKGAPWKGRPILSRATSSTLTPEAFEKVKNKYAEFLEALEYDPIEQAFWEQQKEDPVLNPPIITKFLNLKKQNPGIEYSIQQVGTTEDGTPQHIIIQHGQDVGMAQVILSAANDAVEYQKSAKNRAIQAGKKFTPSSWGIVRPIKGNKAGEKTLLNLLNLTPVITAGIFGKHQVVKTHSDGTKGFDTLQAKQEGEPNAVGPVVIKNEGAWLERVQQGFVTMLLGMQDAKIELYYKGKLVTDFNEVADAPIYWHDGKSYSLNQLAKITTPPPDVSLTKRISSLMWQLVNVERQDGDIGDIEASVFPSKWKDSIRTLDWINQLNSMTRASFNAVGVDQVEGGIENMNLPNKKEYNQINTEIVNRMYGYVENKRDLKYIDVSDVQDGDISFGALGFTNQLPEGNTLEYQFGGDITESTTLSSYFSRLAEGYVKGRSPAVVPPTSQIITMIKKFMRFNPAAMEALTNTFPQQLEYTPEVNLDRIREEMGFSKTVVEAPAPPERGFIGSPEPVTPPTEAVHIPGAFKNLKFDQFAKVISDNKLTKKTAGRDVVWFGAEDYEYTGAKHQQQDMPKQFSDLARQLEKQLGYPEGYFNSVLSNLFPASRQIPFHSDNEKIFIRKDGTIGAVATISLGGTSEISIKDNKTGKIENVFTVENGDLYVMPDGAFQVDKKHAVGPSKDMRISMTFRHIASSKLTSQKPAAPVVRPKKIFIPFSETASQVSSGIKTQTARSSKLGNKNDTFTVQKKPFYLTKDPYQKTMEDIINQDFKVEGFNSPAELEQAFKNLGFNTSNKARRTLWVHEFAPVGETPAPAAPVGSTQGELKLDAALVGERIAEALQRVRDESEVHGHLSDMMVEAGLITPEERAQTVDLGKPDEVYEGGELEQMIDSSAELDPFALSEDIYDRLPLSRFNLEEGPNVIAESKTRQSPADNKSSPIMKGLSYSEKAEAYFDQFLKRNKPYRTKEGKKFTGEESVLAAFSRIVNKDLGLKGSVRVILTSENPNFVIPKKERSFIDEEGNPLVHPNNYIKDVINQMQNPKNADGSRAAPEIGRVVTFGNTHIILLNPESFKKNPNQEKVAMTTLLALAHEIGHPFFDQEYKNLLDGRRKNLLVRLQKDFTKAKLELSKGYAEPGGTEHAYLGERGFEEWYSDQIGRAIIKRARKEPAKTGTDSYFKRVVTKLLQVWNQLNAILRKRFGPATKSVAFEDYIENVIKQHKKANKDNDVLSVNSRIKVRKFIGEVIKPQADKYLSKEQRTWFDAKVKKILTWHESNKLHFLGKEKQHWSMEYLLLPADNYLRRMGPAGAAVADVFYNPSQAEVNQRGHLNARIWYANRRLNKVWDLMEPEKPGNPTAKEIEAFREFLFEAEAEIPTSQLSQKAQEVRNYLEELYTEISDLGIKRREIFYPRQYNIPGLMANKNGEQETLIRLLEIYNKGALKQPGFSFREIVNALITNEETSDDNNVDRAKDISIGMAEERSQYFRRIPNEALRWGVDENGVINMKEQETGILLAPEHALKKYVEDMTKRSDYEKRSVAILTREDVAQFKEFGDVGDKVTGWKAMEVLLSRIEDPAKRQGARNAVKGMLGKTGTGMKSWQRQANSLLLTWNITTYLTMATVASLPDLAGTILRSKNLDGLKGFVNQWKTYYKDREAAQAFARDVGVITFDSLDTMYINAAELGFMTPFTKKLSNAYFKTIGLEAFTKFTRVFAAGMGEQFLLRTAQDSSERATVWLKELGITREEVIYWDSHGRTFDTPQGRKVQDAIAQFVDESVVRPNAAERPVWASNPYFALVWQLKSFFFAYGKNIIGGAIRESKTRYGQTGSIPMAAFPLLLGAVPMLILSMIGLEFRELVKYLVGGGDAAKFRTDTMDWGTYFFEIVDRAGILGAFTLLFPMWTAGNYGDEFWISPLGPTAQRAEDFYKGDFGWIDDGLPYLAAVN